MTWILLVEDDHDGRCLVERRLNAARHEVIATETAEAALDIVDLRGLPDLAVLDITLPGMDGLTLAPALRARRGGADLGVIFLSANVLPYQLAAGLALGGAYLTKPYAACDLLALVNHVLIAARPFEPQAVAR